MHLHFPEKAKSSVRFVNYLASLFMLTKGRACGGRTSATCSTDIKVFIREIVLTLALSVLM